MAESFSRKFFYSVLLVREGALLIIAAVIHGYWNPLDWRKMIFGAVVLLSSLVAGLFYIHCGLVPAIDFHFACDLTAYGLIMNMQKRSPELLAG
jgi:glucose-6-phosphate-specific signal transduction histidine kinase